ncbi:hypothetical protein C2G38_2055707 [Gigaspora rosea]|uniref:G-protein coupled receptors family 1 profile domain-containing protein n=1 Tax=Gigaspora rosea TaxID=44941 RepID=A0A397W8D7_9GLOM|nr:hypothetical protein C2G38_2055707 [Gigaspora rosea]
MSDNSVTGFQPPGLDIIVPLATIFSIFNAVSLIYLLTRISILWWKTKRSLTMVHRVPFYFAFSEFLFFFVNLVNGVYTTVHQFPIQGEACKIMGGITFFLFGCNVTLSGALSLTTYLRICREIVIDLGTYDYKLFLPIILTSLILTLIGDKNYGQSQFWCFSSPTDTITASISVLLIIIILLITLYCYIMTLMEVYNALNRFGAKFGQVDFIVARRITFYILIVILEWVPVVIYLVAKIFHYENLWIYLAATLSVSFGGIGNTILYIIYEKWRNRYSPTASENNRRSSGIEMTRSVVITSSCTNENCS